MKDTLIFSIALNGYQWKYSKHLQSHSQYANKYGYHYQVVTQPHFSKLGVECCWLKLTLMYEALLAGYKQVVFLDADALVQSGCPEIESVLAEGKYLYLAKGYSGRFNSGVIIVKNNINVINWIANVINNRNKSVEIENDVGWGENGHIIEYSNNCDFVQEISQVWNNTYDTNMVSFIRHQNSGPLRSKAIDRLFHKVVFFLSNRALKLFNYFHTNNNILQEETQKILSIYPCFSVVSINKDY